MNDLSLPDSSALFSVIILTRNEERHIERSVRSALRLTPHVYIVDSHSADRTAEIARRFTANIVFGHFSTFSEKMNWAIDNLPIQADWVLVLDADESVTEALRSVLLRVASSPVAEVPEAAFHVNRHFVFLGGVIRHCGYYPSWNVRFFRRGRARYEEREVHEHMVADGPVGFLAGDLVHHDRRPLEHLIAKHNRYSTLEARAIAVQGGGPGDGLPARFFGGPLERRRWIKRNIYPRLPAKFAFRFLWMYLVKLGFLDGVTGWRFCLFIAAYELQIEQKIVELRQQRPAPASGSR